MNTVPPDKNLWSGRSSSAQQPNEYWHECIAFGTVSALNTHAMDDALPKIGLLGYACEEGVKRNNGRIGAAQAPDAIRQQLGRLAAHFDPGTVMDFGDVPCVNGALEETQKTFAQRVAALQAKGILSVGMGGGHDLAYAHFKGIQQGLQNGACPKIGILNFDAHFDLRPTVNGPTSGTPFYQLMTEYSAAVPYYVVGLQSQATPQSLFDQAQAFGVGYSPIEACTIDQAQKVTAELLAFFADCDGLYITVDLDGFAAAHAPGVSAPGPFGFSPEFFNAVFTSLLQSQKLVALDVVELNPKYDHDQNTARLAAQIINLGVVLACKQRSS